MSSESTPYEGLYVELNFRKKNWLLFCTYNPNRNIITNHLDALKRSLDPYSTKYENLMVIGDRNAEINLECMKLFCETYDLSSLIKVPTCYRNPEKPSCIDLILTNQTKNFQNSFVVETGLSDFHKMTVTVTKTTFEKLKPRVCYFRNWNEFCNEKFRTQLLTKLSMENINNSSNGINKFLEICINTLDIFASRKKKYLRRNNMPFMNKNLVNAHRKQTRLRNKFLKNRTESNRVSYNKQQNFCVSLLRKTKKDYYGHLNEKDVIDNKKFWKTVKPLFSDKVKSSEKITLVHEGKIVTTDDENGKILNSLFSNVVKHLKIPEFKDVDFSAECIPHPALKAIMKFRKHPSVSAITSAFNTQSFNFSKVSVDDVLKEVNKLGNRKAIQNTDIPVKILKQNADIFGSYICHFFNICVDKGTFPSVLKHADITPVFKKRIQGFQRKLPTSEYSACHLQNFRKTIMQPNNTFHGSVSV